MAGTGTLNVTDPIGGLCFFVSDLHGVVSRYEKLFQVILDTPPGAVFIGGDLLPHRADSTFVESFLFPELSRLRDKLGRSYPVFQVILGNDDPRCFEPVFQQGEELGFWTYIHNRRHSYRGATVYGYSCVPPTPFLLKDWERYDVSRYCDPGCVSPEEGVRTVEPDRSDIKWGTITGDLERLTGSDPVDSGVFLFHSPPYQTCLDRAALDGRHFDFAPLDVHIGSIAIRRFIERRQPLLTLHGHVHESARLTGQWKTTIGRTVCVSAAHDGPELALVRFDLAAPLEATRELL